MNKTRVKSEKYLFYEALDRRLSKAHPVSQVIQNILRKEGGGYAGELRVDRELCEAHHFNSYIVMKNLLVGSEVTYCQIDSLIIYSKFILIIEVKNIPGLLTYDEVTHQFTRRKDNGPVEGMGNPVDQINRSQRLVKIFLKRFHHEIPVHGIIVFSNPSSILEKPFSDSKAIHVSGLYQALDELHRLYSNQTTPHFDSHHIHKLFESHEPSPTHTQLTPIPKYVFTELKTGVLCPNCITAQLVYKSKIWRCSICKFKSNNSHLETLQEYRLLFSSEITTKEWMRFSGLSSMETSRRMLNESYLEKTGINKNRKWFIPKTIL